MSPKEKSGSIPPKSEVFLPSKDIIESNITPIQARAREMVKSFEMGEIPANISPSDEEVLKAYGIKDALIYTAKSDVLLKELKNRLAKEAEVKIPKTEPVSQEKISDSVSQSGKASTIIDLSTDEPEFVVPAFLRHSIQKPNEALVIESTEPLPPVEAPDLATINPPSRQLPQMAETDKIDEPEQKNWEAVYKEQEPLNWEGLYNKPSRKLPEVVEVDLDHPASFKEIKFANYDEALEDTRTLYDKAKELLSQVGSDDPQYSALREKFDEAEFALANLGHPNEAGLKNPNAVQTLTSAIFVNGLFERLVKNLEAMNVEEMTDARRLKLIMEKAIEAHEKVKQLRSLLINQISNIDNTEDMVSLREEWLRAVEKENKIGIPSDGESYIDAVFVALDAFKDLGSKLLERQKAIAGNGLKIPESLKLSPEIHSSLDNGFAKFNITPEQLSSVEGFAELTPEQQAFLLENFKQILLGLAQEQGKVEFKKELAEAKGLDKKVYTGWQSLPDRFWKNFAKQFYVAKTETIGAKKVFASGFEQHKKLLADLVNQTSQVEVVQDEKGRLEVGYLSAWEGIDKDGQNVLIGFNKAINELSRLPYEWSLPTATKKQQKQYSEARDNYAVYKRFLVNDESFKRAHADGKALLELVQIENKLRLQQFLNTNPEVEKELGRISSDKFWRSALISTVQERGGYFAFGAVARTAAVSALGAIGAPLAAFGAPLVSSLMGGYLGRKRAQSGLLEKDFQTRRGSAESANDKKAGELLTKIRSLDSSIYRQEEVTEVGDIENIGSEFSQINANINKIVLFNKKQQLEPLSEDDENWLLALKRELAELLDKNKEYSFTNGIVYKYTLPFNKRKELEQERDKLESERAKLLATDKNFVSSESLTAKLAKLIIEFNEIDDFDSNDDPEIQQKIQKSLSSLRARLKYTKDKLDKGLVNFGSAEDRLINQQELITALSEGEILTVGISNKNEITERLDKLLARREGKIDLSRKSHLNQQMVKGALLGATFAYAGGVVRHFLFGQDITPEVAQFRQQVGDIDLNQSTTSFENVPNDSINTTFSPDERAIQDLSFKHEELLKLANDKIGAENIKESVTVSGNDQIADLQPYFTIDFSTKPELNIIHPDGSPTTSAFDEKLFAPNDQIIQTNDGKIYLVKSSEIKLALPPEVATHTGLPMGGVTPEHFTDLNSFVKSHFPAGTETIKTGVVIGKNDTVSEALYRAGLHQGMSGEEKVTVINTDGTTIAPENADINLVHEGDTVTVVKHGDITEYIIQKAKGKIGTDQTLQDRYEEIRQKFKLDEIAKADPKFLDQFNTDKDQGGFHEQLNYDEAKAARAAWDKQLKSVTSKEPVRSDVGASVDDDASVHSDKKVEDDHAGAGGEDELPAFYPVAPGSEKYSQLVSLSEAQLAGFKPQDVTLPNSDILTFSDLTSDVDADADLANLVQAKTSEGVVFYQASSKENLTHDQLAQIFVQAKQASNNLTELSDRSFGDRLEAAKFYQVYNQGSNTTQLFEAKPDFELIDNFVDKIGKENLNLLKLDNIYSPEKFHIASKMMENAWDKERINYILSLCSDKQSLDLSLKLIDSDKYDANGVQRGLEIAKRLNLKSESEFIFAELEADKRTEIGTEDATNYAKKLFSDDKFSAVAIQFLQNDKNIIFEDLSYNGSSPHNVTFDTQNINILIQAGERIVTIDHLTDDDLENLSSYLNVNEHVAAPLDGNEQSIIISAENPLTASSLSPEVSQFMAANGFTLKDGNIIEVGGKQYVIDGTVDMVKFLPEGKNLKIVVDKIGDDKPEQVYYLQADGLHSTEGSHDFPLLKEISADNGDVLGNISNFREFKLLDGRSIKFSYDAQGIVDGFLSGTLLQGTTGFEYLSSGFMEKIFAQNNLTNGLTKNQLIEISKYLMRELDVYNEIKNQAEWLQETTFLKENIEETLAEVGNKYGRDVIRRDIIEEILASQRAPLKPGEILPPQPGSTAATDLLIDNLENRPLTQNQAADFLTNAKDRQKRIFEVLLSNGNEAQLSLADLVRVREISDILNGSDLAFHRVWVFSWLAAHDQADYQSGELAKIIGEKLFGPGFNAEHLVFDPITKKFSFDNLTYGNSSRDLIFDLAKMKIYLNDQNGGQFGEANLTDGKIDGLIKNFDDEVNLKKDFTSN